MDISAYEGSQADLAPLAVDLDRTLIKTDSLVEQFLTVLCRSPWQALKTLLRLREGKARFKEALITVSAVDAEALLFNEELLEYLRAERHRGRELHLVTAADQSVADVVAETTGLFASATGSTAGHNLKGMNKLEHLRERFPHGFSYAGDSRADVVIWRHARSAVLVGVRNSTRRIVGGLDCVVEHEIDRRLAGLRDWMKLFRVHQWSKNILLFVPLILGQSFTNLHAVAAVVVGFVAMGMAASGTYVINDISDIAADRAHATKRFRPIAGGLIDAGHALLAALAMIAAGVYIMASQSLVAAGWLLVYLAGTLSYSFAFKRMPMIDIFILGGLYTLRVVIGVYLVGALMSHWLLMFSFFFFFSLSMAKRHVEIANAARRLGDGVQIKGRHDNRATPMQKAAGKAVI